MDTQTYCEKKQIKLTPLRANILNIIEEHNAPITAYEILDKLKQINPKAQVMSVYRVINFLQKNGLTHRIESLNAVMMCCHLAEKHSSQWLICQQCHTTKECALPAMDDVIADLEKQTGFSVTTQTVELSGLCPNCKPTWN